MDGSSNLRTGGQILIDVLALNNVDTVFCVPGESYLAALDAFHDVQDRIRLIVCRQEAGAANMAEAYGKLTGKPGICFVTRGPGATQACVGVHTARQDSTPMILFVGQVARAMTEREAFQEIDFRRMFGEMTKWVAQIDDPARIPEMVGRAFRVAMSGRPGPVVLALPEDMLRELAAAEDGLPGVASQAAPGVAEMADLRQRLAAAKAPLVMVGGGGWTEAACADVRTFAEANQLPVAAAFRRQDHFDNAHPHYAGEVGIGMNPALEKRIRDADLLLVLGAQLSEIITNGYTLFDMPKLRQSLIHVHADADELGKVYQPDLAINAGPAPMAAALAAMEPVANPAWAGAAAEAHAAYEAWQQPERDAGKVDYAQVVTWLRENLPPDAIVTNGAGNYTVWVHRFHRYRGLGTQLAPQSGAMGYGVPAGVAAGIVHPDRPVVTFAGDGCFLMSGQELATAAQYNARVVFIVVNNGMYGTIRMHQERHYPGRLSGTALVNPDFADYARAFGIPGEIVERTEDFAAAFERARATDGPALIELRVDPDAITPRTTLSAIRAAAEKAGAKS